MFEHSIEYEMKAHDARRGTLEPIDHQWLLERVHAGEVTVLDVRTAEEYEAAHTPGGQAP